MKTIYVDEMLLLNLIINYLLLVTTAKLCALPLKRLRFALSALLGAGYSVAVLLPELGFLASPVMKLVLAGAMALAAFGNVRKLLRPYIVFLSVSAAFGGAVIAASLLAGGSAPNGYFIGASLKTLVLTFGAAYFVFSLVFSRIVKRRARETVSVCLSLAGKSTTFTALKDTGNELFDPISGLPVMVLDGSAAKDILPEDCHAALGAGGAELIEAISQNSALCSRLRLVPYRAVGTDGGLLPVLRPDTLTINGKENRNLLVGLSPISMCADGEFSAII